MERYAAESGHRSAMSLPGNVTVIRKMNQDSEHLRLLAIFHYVVSGLAVLFSLFPLIYTTIGAIFVLVARRGTPKPG